MDLPPQTLLARALYDNQADNPDELAFCRGDILTVLGQAVAGSEGWWPCLLHGRPGLAPANRLQVLPDRQAPVGPPRRAAPGGPRDRGTEPTYQVPAPLSAPLAGPVYEPMRSWVARLPPAAQVYELPQPTVPRSTPGGAQGTTCDGGGDRTRVSARIVCEKTGRLAQQAVVTAPRPARASLPTLPPRGSEAPVQGWGPSMLQGLTLPTTSTAGLQTGCFGTLPNPQKAEWVYDTLGPPQPAGTRNLPLTSLAETSGPRPVPPHTASLLGRLNAKAMCPTPCLPETAPTGKKSSLPAAPRDAGYRVPPSFQSPRVEAQNTRPNIYDIPKGQPGALQATKARGEGWGSSEKHPELTPSWLPRLAAWPGPEPDRASESSSDSRASLLSSTSTDSSSSSCSEEWARELPGDLSRARETVTALQQHVAGSVAGLMLFVSRTWRFRDHLEANIAAIRSAADRVEESLREFLDFAQVVGRAAACRLTDGVLQARVRDQLQTICDSYQILLETKGALESSDWSLEALATDKLQNSPDDLERFVMVARTVPEDIKRFASMVIANGKLLFGQSSEGEEMGPSAPKAEPGRLALLLPRGPESPQRHAPCTDHPPEPLQEKTPSARHQTLSSREENEKPRLMEDQDPDTQRPGSVLPRPPSRPAPERRVQLSEHGRLYFGALLKAVGVLSSGLHAGQPPEVFITQSKLVITVGQKLVDTLCQETRGRDTRNEILCRTSQLCGLLRDLALATKRAVLQYPSSDARTHLQAQAMLLERHALRFRGTLE